MTAKIIQFVPRHSAEPQQGGDAPVVDIGDAIGMREEARSSLKTSQHELCEDLNNTSHAEHAKIAQNLELVRNTTIKCDLCEHGWWSVVAGRFDPFSRTYQGNIMHAFSMPFCSCTAEKRTAVIAGLDHDSFYDEMLKHVRKAERMVCKSFICSVTKCPFHSENEWHGCSKFKHGTNLVAECRIFIDTPLGHIDPTPNPPE